MDALALLFKIESELDSLRSKYKSRMPPDKYKVWCKNQMSVARQYSRYLAVHAEYTKSVKVHKSRIAELAWVGKEPELDSLTKQRKTLDAQISAATVEYSRARDDVDLASQLDESIAKLVKKVRKFGALPRRDYASQAAQCRTTLRLSKLLNTDGAVCPTCMSELDLESIAQAVAQAQRGLTEAQLGIEYMSTLDSLSTFKTKRRRVTVRQADLDAIVRQGKSLKERRDEVDAAIVARIGLSKAINDMDSLSAPDVVDRPESDMGYEVAAAHYAQCESILSLVRRRNDILAANSSLASLSEVRAAQKVNEYKTKLTSTLSKASRTLKALQEKHACLSEAVELEAARASAHAVHVKELDVVCAEIRELEPQIQDRKVLESLVRAYSTKGLKTLAANEICRLLEQNLNQYRDLIFMEPFEFYVSASDSGLSIIVDRGNGVVSDVRLLSGAESNCFRLLFVLALLPLVPESRRLNVLVLDEPTSLMHSVTRDVFMDRYVPAIRAMVPNVFIITPNDEYAEGSTEWIVEKSGGVSSVVT